MENNTNNNKVRNKLYNDDNDSNNKMMDIVVVGAGLSGLLVCRGIQKYNNNNNNNNNNNKEQLDWMLLEATSISGGRLRNNKRLSTKTSGNKEFGDIDMGGAWIWPNYQPEISKLLLSEDMSSSIQTFVQPDDSSSMRIVGGAVQIINQIESSLPSNKVQHNSPVVSCKLIKENNNNSNDESYIEITVRRKKNENDDNEGECIVYRTKKIVFAVPPKLIIKSIQFDPPLSDVKQAAMSKSQTWMAGVTKVALIYKEKFWDSTSSNMGLARSSNSPAFQVYDSSTNDDKVFALTFFALVPPSSLAYTDDKILAKQVANQLYQTWKYNDSNAMADLAPSYTEYYVQRWSLESYVSDDPTPIRINPHPYPVKELSTVEWNNDNNQIYFAGSETDQRSPGVMEGAVGSANRVLKEMLLTRE